MLATLKGAALYVAGGIALAVVGAATFLVNSGVLSGSDWLTVITLILTGVVGITSAHVAGQTAAAAINVVPPSATSVPSDVPPQPMAAPPEQVI